MPSSVLGMEIAPKLMSSCHLEGGGVMEKKPFVKPTLKEEASLTEATLMLISITL